MRPEISRRNYDHSCSLKIILHYNSEGRVAVTYTAAASADVEVSEFSGGFDDGVVASTFWQNDDGQWVEGKYQPGSSNVENAFRRGEVCYAKIMFNEDHNGVSDRWSQSELFNLTMKHELGHVVGMLHPYEKDETPTDCESLMLWDVDEASNVFTAFDQDELEKKYPDGVV